MDKEQCLCVFLSHIRQLTTKTQSDDDCRVIDWINSFVPELKQHGYTVGYAYEPQEVHLVGKVESYKSLASYGSSMVGVINEVIIGGIDFNVLSKDKTKIKKIRCTPLPNSSDFGNKLDGMEDYENPFWVIEPINFNHTPFIGVAQSAYCIGFITDCL